MGSLSRKSQADIIPAILFLTVVIGIALTYQGFQKSMILTDVKVDNQVQKYEVADHVRRAIIDCHGYPLPHDLERCDIPFDKESGIRGYQLRVEKFVFCVNETLIDFLPDEFDETISYLLPINVNNTVCPGALVIYI